MKGKGVELYRDDAVWARFYREGKTIGQICEEFECGVYDLSPWLTAPLVRSALKQSSSPVTVTPLEWNSYNIDMYKAETFFGSYVVSASGMWWLRGIGDEETHQCVNYQKAFEEAQADYEELILSSLSTPYTPTGE